MPKTLQDKDLKADYKFLVRDYTEDIRAHDDATVNFEAYEAMSNAQTYDATSKQTKNELTDSMTATIYLERAARVAGQLPEGEVRALGRRDVGKGMLMDIIRTKWIYPNANAQRPLEQKMFMWQYGSSEYGYMPMYYDLNVSQDGKYFGPDCWLWNPRKFIPQNGFTSIAEMDHVHALAEKSPSWFLDIVEDDTDDTFDIPAINSVIEQIKNGTREKDPKRDTKKHREESSQSVRQVIVATRYESGKDGRWISFLPDFGNIVIRDVPNPHKNGRIPFVIKPCIPTFDSFYNVGDFQRSMPMQFANDGLDNFYFQGIKINLFPPIIVNAQGVVPHTIKPGEPASVWEETEPNSIRRLDTSTAGLATYTSAKGMAKGAVQSIAGTTDTRSNAEDASDPAFGKTPEALKMIGDRESTRDNQDRKMLETAMQELIDGWLSLIPLITDTIPIDLFQDEIAQIAKTHPDITEVFKATRDTGLMKWRVSQSGQQMRIRIDPSKLNGLIYRFQLEPNSTAKKTREQQLTAFQGFFDFIGKVPNILQSLQEQTGETLNAKWIAEKYGELSDIDGFENAFTKVPQQPAAAGGGNGEVADETDIADANAALGGGEGGNPQPPAPAPQAPQPVAVVNGVPFFDEALAAEAQALFDRTASRAAAPVPA